MYRAANSKLVGGGAVPLATPLCYVRDDEPGYSRRGGGQHFRYFDNRGRLLRNSETLARLDRLRIPPAWTEVWICPRDDGHLQATGRDRRGRKQYLYHPAWTVERSTVKYDRILEFASFLPRIRRRVARDFALPGLPKEKVLATVLRLMERTLIRVGNEQYVRENGSYGLTTLRDRHRTFAEAACG